MKKEEMIEEIKESLWENLRSEKDMIIDGLLATHYPGLESMTEAEVEECWKNETGFYMP